MAPTGQAPGVVVTVALLALGGCQCQPNDYGAVCTMARSDGGVLLYGDVVAGSDLIAVNAVECGQQVCLRQADAGLGAANQQVTGYCTGQCPAAGSCPALHDGVAGSCDVLDTAAPVPGLSADARYCVYPLSP
jgi:hypothetical protein